VIRVPAIPARHTGLALLLGYALFCLLYLGSHALRLRAPLPLQRGALEQAIPLIDWSIWIYFSQFLLLPAAIVLARDTHQRSRLFYACLLATLIAALFFLLLPTELARPTQPQAGLTGLAWAALFASDVSGNCFPSLHAALAVLSGFALWQRGWQVPAVLWPLAIAVATLTTRQHVLWDTLAGMALAVLAWTFTPRLFRYD
jgi:PAP2 superfamily